MKAIEIRQMTDEELAASLDNIQQELFNLRLQESLGQLEKPSHIKQLRRDVARHKTVITERKQAAKKPATSAVIKETSAETLAEAAVTKD